jgi:hypothetical protein
MAASPVSVRIYSILCRLALPADFRRKYGRSLVHAFHDLHRDARDTRPLWTIVREFGLLVGTAFKIRVETRRERNENKRLRRQRREGWGVAAAPDL